MALNFQNVYSGTVWVAFLYHAPSCVGTPWKKVGWWQVNSGQIYNAWNVNLRTINRFAAFFALDSSRRDTWGGTGNKWYAVPERAFSQCYDDNTDCNLEFNFRELDFNGFYDVTVVLGPGAGKVNIKGLAPKKPPP
jgi:uncharacterized membrane protein